MHEYSIIQSLMERVDAEAEARRSTVVRRLTVRIGELSGVESGLLATAFDMFREGTICAGATLDIVPVAARWACPACGTAIATGSVLACQACRRPARLVEGDEIILDRIEMEVDDDV